MPDAVHQRSTAFAMPQPVLAAAAAAESSRLLDNSWGFRPSTFRAATPLTRVDRLPVSGGLPLARGHIPIKKQLPPAAGRCTTALHMAGQHGVCRRRTRMRCCGCAQRMRLALTALAPLSVSRVSRACCQRFGVCLHSFVLLCTGGHLVTLSGMCFGCHSGCATLAANTYVA